ncbi:MAG: hypothetical protein HDS16_05010 [Bacteroides sp.]|nr:hypothetical protein [Bacteroides sp.]
MIIRNSAKIVKEQKGLVAALTGADNISPTQEYDEATGVYSPDWTLLRPVFVPDIRNNDGMAVPDTDIVKKAWFVIQPDGSEKQIESTDTGFELYPSGYPLGIRIKRNILVDKPLGLVFRYTAYGFTGMAAETFVTHNNPAPTPDLELDFPVASAWNPFTTDRDKVTVTPTVRDFGKNGLVVEWFKRDGSTWRTIDPSDPKDAELNYDVATKAVTIDRRWMGDSISLVCRLTDTSATPNVVLRERPVTIRRRIPEYTASINMASIFGADDKSVMAEAYIRMGMETLKDPSKELRLTWYNGNTATGEGNKKSFPTGAAETIEVGLDINDRGPMKLLTYNGTYLTYDGKLLGGR